MSLHYTREAYIACKMCLRWIQPIQARKDHPVTDQIRLDMTCDFLDMAIKAMQGDTESGQFLRQLVED